MSVNIRVVRTVSNPSAGTQEIIFSGFGTPKAAVIFMCGNPSGVGSASDQHRFSYGATDGTRQWVVAGHDQHNVGTTETARREATTHLAMLVDSSGAVLREASFDAWITDGIRINWTTVSDSSVQRAMIVILIGGSSVEARADTVALSTQNTGVTYSSMGFEADLMLCGTGGGDFSDSALSDLMPSLGLVHNNRAGTITQAAIAISSGDALDISSVGGEIITDGGALQSLAAGTTWRGEFSAFGSSGFTVTARDGNSSGDVVGFLGLRLTGASSWVGVVTTPTATGNASVTTPGFEPQFVMQFTSAFRNTNTHQSDGEAGVLGISAFDGFTEGAMCVASQDNVTTSNTQSLADDVAVLVTAQDGAVIATAQFVSFNSDGWTLNYSTANASARKYIALAISGGGGGVSVPALGLTGGLHQMSGGIA